MINGSFSTRISWQESLRIGWVFVRGGLWGMIRGEDGVTISTHWQGKP